MSTPLPAPDAAAADAAPRARARLPQPAPWLVAGLALWGVLGIVASVGWVSERLWQVAGAALLMLAGMDLFRLLRRPTPAVQRGIAEVLALGQPCAVQLQFAAGRVRQVLDVHDHHPGCWQVHDLPHRVRLHPGTVTTLRYEARPPLRGAFTFAGTDVCLLSPLRLWQHLRHTGTMQAVRVVPDTTHLTRLVWFSAAHAERLAGVHITRRRGEGTDFRQLRDYRQGDSLRQIDWKATRRARRLISREYQDETRQQVLLLLDGGRRMLARDGELAHFDHALNACLLLARIALRRGDAVGLYATGSAPRWVLPQRGAAAMQAILHTSYDLQPAAIETDYPAVAAAVAARQRRRALLVLVTNLRDEDVDDVRAGIALLQRRHVVVVASLRERALDAALDVPITNLDDAVRAGALAEYRARRTAAHATLRQHRVSVLDVTADELPAALAGEYLAIKRSGRL